MTYGQAKKYIAKLTLDERLRLNDLLNNFAIHQEEEYSEDNPKGE